jgi:hypothetical protein
LFKIVGQPLQLVGPPCSRVNEQLSPSDKSLIKKKDVDQLAKQYRNSHPEVVNRLNKLLAALAGLNDGTTEIVGSVLNPLVTQKMTSPVISAREYSITFTTSKIKDLDAYLRSPDPFYIPCH